MTELLFLSWRHLSRAEKTCLAVLLIAFVAWLLLPAIPQDPRYHAFVDRRAWLGVPRAADVLSNIAFIVVGIFGIATLLSPNRVRFPAATEASLWCIGLGYTLTGIGSAWYHLDPNDATLVWDRLPMTLVFSGILCAALAQRIGQNVARVALALLFELGVASVVYWAVTGNLTLYAVVQFGGAAALLVLLALTRRGDDPFPWWWVIGWYVAAKLLEAGDSLVFRATHGIIAGHALKHIAAAAAGAGLLLTLRRSSRRRSTTPP